MGVVQCEVHGRQSVQLICAEIDSALNGSVYLRRRAFLPARAPIGLLTHHRVHDEPVWRLLEALIAFVKDELGGEFVDVEIVGSRDYDLIARPLGVL